MRWWLRYRTLIQVATFTPYLYVLGGLYRCTVTLPLRTFGRYGSLDLYHLPAGAAPALRVTLFCRWMTVLLHGCGCCGWLVAVTTHTFVIPRFTLVALIYGLVFVVRTLLRSRLHVWLDTLPTRPVTLRTYIPVTGLPDG